MGFKRWWLKELSDSERIEILSTFKPMGGDGRLLILSNINKSQYSYFLSILAGWFKNNNRELGYKILQEAVEGLNSNSTVLEQHFTYNSLIEFYYKDRNKGQKYLDKALEYCRKQISLSKAAIREFKKQENYFLPSHRGFYQLSVYEEKQKNYKEALDLAQQAQADGWQGDWKNRIERLKKKLASKNI
jgi:tetratricopeptide (TPR) repeat protein